MNRQVEDKLMPLFTPHKHVWLYTRGWQLMLLIAVLLCGTLWIATASVVFAQGTYDYTVQNGDSWPSVAASTGVSVEVLQAANPEAAERESGWLLVGEILKVPAPQAVAAPTRKHTVQSGESWNSIAKDYGVSVALLRAANPLSIRAGNLLFRGEVLVIPTPGASVAPAAPAATPTATARATVSGTDAVSDAVSDPDETATPTATEVEPADDVSATVTATVEATSTVEVEATVEASEGITTSEGETSTSITDTESTTETVSGAEEGEETAGEVTVDLPECPERFADYPEAMTDLVNSAGAEGVDAVVAFLTACNALVDDGAQMVDLNGDAIDDLIAVYQNPSEDQTFVEGDLVIFDSTEDGHVLGYRARAAGEVRLLTVADINLDTLPDVSWVDTTCGASTCFDTVNVRSWDGSTWGDWTDGTITMAYAEIGLADVSEEGSGEEITLEGGIYGSVGAGPQRSRSEVWASVEGNPYSLLEKSYSSTECLYHTVLDANRAFLDAPVNGFEAATALYNQAATDDALIKCWVRNDELAELKSFSLFRQALIAAYSGDAAAAEAKIAELTAQYPGSIYDEVGQVWLASYQDSGDPAIACEDVTIFAEENSAVWEMLADYGYTNPSFEAVDVCPILEMGEATEGTAEATATP